MVRVFSQRTRIDGIASGGRTTTIFFSWRQFVPALPVEQSNAIILGKVTDRRAVLMDDKFGIYSEFSIKISEIFKDDLGGFFIDQVITTSRPGGAVRFPSGKIQQYTISLQGYPQQDKAYVLFLKRDEVGDYSIVTGYEINGNVVQPLDGNETFRRMNLTCNSVFTGALVWSHSAMLFRKLYSKQEEIAINENTSQIRSHPRPHHFCSILSFLVAAVRAQVSCTPPPTQGKSTAWKQGATVNVMIDPTFSPTQQQAIKDQFDKWKNAGGANVTFKFVDPSQAGGGATTGGPPVLSVIRQIPEKKGRNSARRDTRDFRSMERAGILP